MRQGVLVFCGGCGDTAEVSKVTPGLRHACGSTRIGLVGIDEMPARVAKPQGPGTGWNRPMPDPAANWSSYPGPLPGPNPVHNPPVADTMVCPVCKGAGYDIQDKTVCRMCGGSGVMTATTARPAVEQYDSHAGPPVGGARHAAVSPPSHWIERDADGKEIRRVPHEDIARLLSDPRNGWTPDLERNGRVLHARDPQGGYHRLEAFPRGSRAQARHVAGRPSTTSPYGTAEYQNTRGGGYYQGRGVPSEPFSAENEDTWYPKADTQSPAVRVRQERDYGQGGERPYQLNEASCPECGHAPTELRKTPADRHGNQDAVWTCPRCGPLVNIDRNPQVDPYRPHDTGYQGADRKALGKLSRMALLRGEQRSGKLLRILATIQQHNTLSLREGLGLARQTLAKYPEGRG